MCLGIIAKVPLEQDVYICVFLCFYLLPMFY